MKSFIKLFLLFIITTSLIVFSGLGLRWLCIKNLNSSKKIEITAAEKESSFVFLKEDTVLYKTSKLKEQIITLPKNFYAELLTGTDTEIIKVSYNGIIGFIENQNIEIKTPTGTIFQTAIAETASTHGTYLRAEPNTDSKILTLVHPSSKLGYIGKTNGEIPTDGTSDVWLYVTFEEGPTTIHRGYIYSERVILSAITQIEKETEAENAETTLGSTTGSLENQTPLTGTINLSSGVKWFLIILFSSLAIIIFVLLMLAPKKEPGKTKPTEPPKSETPSPEQKLSRYKKNKFRGGYKLKKPSTAFESEHSSSFGEFQHSPKRKPASPSTSFNSKSSLPPYIRRYFNVSENIPEDDEL